ncbi:MAG: EamA family transporter [Cyanobacteria bacterium P01_G01_bin.19]
MKISSILELLLLASVWGASFLFVRIAVPVLGPVWLIELRVLLSGLTILLLSMRLNTVREIRANLASLFVLGCINLAIPFVLFAIAALYLPASFAAILNATAPLFGIIIAALWSNEKFTWSRFLGLVIGFCGVTILVGWTNIPWTISFVGSTIAGLSGALMYAIAAPFAKDRLSGVSSVAIATGSQLSAAIVLLPLIPFFPPTTAVSWEVATVTIALALFSTALAYILYFRLIDCIGVSNTLTVAYLVPLFAMLWGAIFLQESITVSMLVGCSLILSGTAISVTKSK